MTSETGVPLASVPPSATKRTTMSRSVTTPTGRVAVDHGQEAGAGLPHRPRRLRDARVGGHRRTSVAIASLTFIAGLPSRVDEGAGYRGSSTVSRSDGRGLNWFPAETATVPLASSRAPRTGSRVPRLHDCRPVAETHRADPPPARRVDGQVDPPAAADGEEPRAVGGWRLPDLGAARGVERRDACAADRDPAEVDASAGAVHRRGLRRDALAGGHRPGPPDRPVGPVRGDATGLLHEDAGRERGQDLRRAGPGPEDRPARAVEGHQDAGQGRPGGGVARLDEGRVDPPGGVGDGHRRDVELVLPVEAGIGDREHAAGRRSHEERGLGVERRRAQEEVGAGDAGAVGADGAGTAGNDPSAAVDRPEVVALDADWAVGPVRLERLRLGTVVAVAAAEAAAGRPAQAAVRSGARASRRGRPRSEMTTTPPSGPGVDGAARRRARPARRDGDRRGRGAAASARTGGERPRGSGSPRDRDARPPRGRRCPG